MNIFSGHIATIQVNESLSLVSIQMNEHITLQTIVVETPATVSYLQKENPIRVLFKETEVIIAKIATPQISILNSIEGTINTIEKGILLSKITIDTSIGVIVSILTTQAMDKLELAAQQKVVALIKSNEIMVAE